MISNAGFHELKAIVRLPSPSGVALAIMKLVQQEDATLQQVAQLIKTDPALSGRILSFANSAAFGAHRAIASIPDAAMMMGMQALRNFALSLSLIDNNKQGNCKGFDYELYWSRSLAMAVAMAVVTVRERTIAPEEAFTFGLLTDVGRLALASAWPDAYTECLQSAKGEQLRKMEQTLFAIDQHSMCLFLLANWGMPKPFLDALKICFNLEKPGEDSRIARLAKQLSFSGKISQYCQADPSLQPEIFKQLSKTAGDHALESAELTCLLETIIEKWHNWGREIDVKTERRISLNPARKYAETKTADLKLLLVDDDALLIARLSKQLTAAGYNVAVRTDGESALTYIVEQCPSILITDWRMQPMDGISLCKTLRTTDFGRMMYIIMLTAEESQDDLIAAFDAGIDDYVTKPVSSPVLLARLRAGKRIVQLQQEIDIERREVQRASSELLTINRRFELLAHTDMLTDLPNRRYGLNRLAQEFETALRFKRPISILMLDLDHFKIINDSLGHDAGDQALVHTAKLIKQAIRNSDIACRLGGEEFIVIATNTDGVTALGLAERIRHAIENSQPPGLSLCQPLTVSIGVAGSTGWEHESKELIARADKALYQIKLGKRNGVQLAD